MMRLLRLGDRVRFDGAEYQVAELAGCRVRLVGTDGQASVVLLTHLVDSPDFELVGQQDALPAHGGLSDVGLDDVPPEEATAARAWERHIIEVETGLAPGSPPGAVPRPEYDPSQSTLGQRMAAKAAELTRAGQPTSLRTVERMRARYRSGGLRGLVDGRTTRTWLPEGRVDARVVDAVRTAVAEESQRSTGTRKRLYRRVAALLTDEHGPDAVPMPSQATFNRLVAKIAAGQHTFGAATTRRSAANRPERPFTATWAWRPGQQVQIDTTVLDVLAAFDDGVPRRIELTAAVDVATRSICAAVLRPKGTKAVDAALLLARMLVPEPMRPGWDESLRMAASRLPHRRLSDIDARMAEAAAKPVVVPETIVCDRGGAFMSQTFLDACQRLGISVQPAHPQTPTDKAVIERTFGSINTLFCQYVAGYTGSDTTRRGAAPEREPLWALDQLRALLEEWIIAGWQDRPHESLTSPDTGRRLSPNEMYAVLVSTAGYLPLMLSGDDYIELLPAVWRTINDYGVRIGGRTYDAKALNPHRRQHSGVTAHRGLWEVHYDPYDLTCVYVRDHRNGGWIRAPWTHLSMAAAPFADFTWRHAQHQVADEDSQERETATARVLSNLLDRAEHGPETAPTDKDRRVAARTRAAPASDRPPPASQEEEDDARPAEADSTEDNVIPFGVFDARAEARRWP